ncbi:hypothetical protein FHL15_003632 [Xylaria flabelliformis]|uniref:Uncharacterized protein n=1 Tax=Xylaria flabelliformis TaxID=2512241 RepID=A0A553I681_9PEZI|nr:hypothetical protein FHL15_003632 [Xylaria flabelliformis]
MAAEHTSKSSPEPHLLEVDPQIDSQDSSMIESNFIAPLEDSQETLDVVSCGSKSNGDHETEVISQPLQPMKGAFISRPQREDPLDFQNGFQYSRAPTLQSLPFQPSVLPKVISRQSGSRNDGVVITEHQSRDTRPQTADDLFDGSRNVQTTATQASEPLPNIKEKTHDAVSNHSDPHSDSTMSGGDRPEKQRLDAAQDDPTLRPPFHISSPFSKISAASQHPREYSRSPTTKLGEPKLSKAFSNIQRKALIQSAHTTHHSKSQVDRVSPSMFNRSRLHQDATNIPEITNSQTRQHQQQPNSDYVSDKSPATPGGAEAVVQSSRNNRNSATRTTHPSAHEDDEDYNISTRSESRTSNISKSRAPPVLKHKRSQRRQARQIQEDSNVHRQKLAESWNNYFVHEDSQRRHWKDQVDCMITELAERDDRVAKYLTEIRKQDQLIIDLKSANEEQCALYEKQESVLAELEKRRQSLRSKMKECKDHLNDSTKERQKIYNYFQSRYQQMREQIEKAAQNHQSSLMQALSTTDKAREEIRTSVQEIRMLSQEEIQKQIATLQERLAEREKEVDREKNYTNGLRQELKESHEVNEGALKVLNGQSQELIKMGHERATQVQNIENCLEQQGLEIQSLLKLFENDRAQTVSHSELAQSLKVLQMELSESVLSEFREHAASDRKLSSKTTTDLRAEILAIHELCTGLSQQIQDKQNASEWQEKHGMAQMDNQALHLEIDQLQKELLQMRNEARTQLYQHAILQQELTTLRAGAEAADAAKNRIENLENAKQKISESLDEKEKRIGILEGKLRSAEETLSIQDRQLKNQERQVLNEKEKHKQAIAGYLEQQKQAVEQAKTEESAKTRAQCEMVQGRLQDAEQRCSQLQQELAQAKEGSENALKSKEEESARQMQETMEPTIKQINELLEELQAVEQEKGDLTANLEAWSNDHIELSLLRQVIRKLAEDQKAAIGNGKQLWELLDVQKKLEGTWQSHKSEVDAIKRAIELEKSVIAERERESGRRRKGKGPIEISHVGNRRVTIQFPRDKDTGNGSVVPMSVEEERATRRQAASPTGIMKPALLQVEGQLKRSYHKIPVPARETRGRPERRVANRGVAPVLVSHSAYNRPVLGTEEPIPENTGSVFADMPSTMKRKRAESKAEGRENFEKKESQSTEKRATKISRSESNYFHDLVPQELITSPIQQQLQLGLSRGGPTERRSRSFVTNGSMGSGTQ